MQRKVTEQAAANQVGDGFKKKKKSWPTQLSSVVVRRRCCTKYNYTMNHLEEFLMKNIL